MKTDKEKLDELKAAAKDVSDHFWLALPERGSLDPLTTKSMALLTVKVQILQHLLSLLEEG